jgi:hypothetical protein
MPGEIHGNGGMWIICYFIHKYLTVITERYNYDASTAFDYSTFPASRFMNEFGSVFTCVLCI